jgi:hypothetical protein
MFGAEKEILRNSSVTFAVLIAKELHKEQDNMLTVVFVMNQYGDLKRN